jgi:hypothetical protein
VHSTAALPLWAVFLAWVGMSSSDACVGAAASDALILSAGKKCLLVDAVHANDYSSNGLRPDEYDYHRAHGHRWALEYLQSRGIRVEYHREGRLSDRRLASCDALFIGLVSAERPPFLVSEIAAIRAFVERGGSLLVITDHTNCYYHAWRLMPLFEELGLATFTDAACDEPPYTLGRGNGWIAVRRFTKHPVTIGLECIAPQTGGCVDPRFAVARTSDRAWADAWTIAPFGEGCSPGFFGNFRRDPGERSGPLGVVAAKEFGKGRIVVVGDQNIFGDVFLNYADNYRLWLNAMAWLLEIQGLRDPTPYLRWRSPRLLLYEQYDRAAWGADDGSGCHFAQALLCRHYWAFANDRLAEPCDLVVFPDSDRRLPPEGVDAVAAHLRSGKNVLFLNTEYVAGDAEVALGQILAAVGGTHSKAKTGEEKLTIQLPQGGRIHVLGMDSAFDNTTLAPPHRTPNDAEAKRAKTLVDAVGNALEPARK